MVDREKPGVGFRDEGKHTKRNDLLFVQKMMLMVETSPVPNILSSKVV